MSDAAMSNAADRRVANLLMEHMLACDFRGLDPAAIRYSRRMRLLTEAPRRIPLFGRAWNYGAHQLLRLAGHRAHALLRPQTLQYSKGIALVVSGLAAGGGSAGRDPAALVRTLLDGLLGRRLSEGVWSHEHAYPIRGVDVTPLTPNLVTSAFVARALWDAWTAYAEVDYHAAFVDAVEAMRRTFPFLAAPGGGCFMYTPDSRYYVHNANLLMAELLARDAAVYARSEQEVRAAVGYTLHDMRRTASVPYAGPPSPNGYVDNYHTGYVLRCLRELSIRRPEVLEELDAGPAIDAGVAFYFDRFVRDGRIWKDDRKRLESHSCAEAILILKDLGDRMPADKRSAMVEAIRRTVADLWASDYFIYTRSRYPGIGWVTDRTDMVRWSQAWMYLALSHPDRSGGTIDATLQLDMAAS